MAQEVAKRVNEEELRVLLKGASAEQVQAAASALEKLLKELDGEDTPSIERQGLAVHYSCDEQRRLLFHAQLWPQIVGVDYEFEGQGEGSRAGRGADVLKVGPFPRKVFTDTAHFLVLPPLTCSIDLPPPPREYGCLFFLDSHFRPLNCGLILPFQCAPAFGLGHWNVLPPTIK